MIMIDGCDDDMIMIMMIIPIVMTLVVIPRHDWYILTITIEIILLIYNDLYHFQ